MSSPESIVMRNMAKPQSTETGYGMLASCKVHAMGHRVLKCELEKNM